MKGPLLNLFGIFAFLKAFFSPKSEIYTPKRDDEHPCPSHMGILFLDPFHIQGFTLTKVIKQTPEQLEIGQWLSLDVAVIVGLWLVLLSEKPSSTSRVEVLTDTKIIYVNCGVKN